MTSASSMFKFGLVAGLTAGFVTWLVVRRRDQRQAADTISYNAAYDDPVDQENAASFPASDPPSHAATLGAKT
jgi:hypothetical protein